jgi:hypothetical protein
MEEAKLLWAQGQHSMAIQLGRALLNKMKADAHGDAEQLTRLQSLLGKWLAWNRCPTHLPCSCICVLEISPRFHNDITQDPNVMMMMEEHILMSCKGVAGVSVDIITTRFSCQKTGVCRPAAGAAGRLLKPYLLLDLPDLSRTQSIVVSVCTVRLTGSYVADHAGLRARRQCWR